MKENIQKITYLLLLGLLLMFFQEYKVVPFIQAMLILLAGLLLTKTLVEEWEKRQWPFVGGLFFFMLLLIVFSIGEQLTRAYDNHTDLLGLTGQKPTRNLMNHWAMTDAYAAYIARPDLKYEEIDKSVNSTGYISTPEIALPKPDRTIRVVFFGGSSTAGTGCILADTQSWPSLTMINLQKRFPHLKFDFINAALSGYTTFESFGRYWSRIRFMQPDLLVLNHAWNEMYYFSEADRIDQWRSGIQGWGLDQEQIQIVYPPYRIDRFIAFSQILSKLRLKWAHYVNPTSLGEIQTGPSKELDDCYNQRGPEIFADNLQLFKTVAQLEKTKLWVCKQPTLIVPQLTKEQQQKCRYDYHGFDHDAHVSAFEALYEKIDELFPQQAIIDLRSLSGQAELFCDHIHPTPEGARAYSEIVADSLAVYIQEEYSSSLSD